MDSDKHYERRCMIPGCPEYGVWIKLPPGVEPYATDDPRNHYQHHHYGRDRTEPVPVRKAARA